MWRLVVATLCVAAAGCDSDTARTPPKAGAIERAREVQDSSQKRATDFDSLQEVLDSAS